MSVAASTHWFGLTDYFSITDFAKLMQRASCMCVCCISFTVGTKLVVSSVCLLCCLPIAVNSSKAPLSMSISIFRSLHTNRLLTCRRWLTNKSSIKKKKNSSGKIWCWTVCESIAHGSHHNLAEQTRLLKLLQGERRVSRMLCSRWFNSSTCFTHYSLAADH